jgi:GDPmannose 4,6-dehydratase
VTAQRTALITGVLGQDGSYLAEHLRARDYRVVGVSRAEFDLAAPPSVDWATELVADVKPDEVYHLAACHHSSTDRDDPAQQQRMVLVNYTAALALAHALIARGSGRLVVAGSSQMYTAQDPPRRIDEATPHAPSTFYGVTKAATRDALRWLREHRGLHTATAILFNHESPRRSPMFASRKIVQAAVRVAAGEARTLEVVDLSSRTDWSWAPDVVAALHAMAMAETPDDRVVASGELHTIAELCEVAFAAVGRDWRDHVACAKPPGDRPALVGDARALERDGWARTREFADWVTEMVCAEQATMNAASGMQAV